MSQDADDTTATGTLPLATVYTDGGCSPNPGPGGWAAALLLPGRGPVELAGGDPHSTNNRMELTAAIEALRALDGPHRVVLHTDSVYLRSGITRWISNWKRRGWTTRDGQPVLNQDLWQALEREATRHRIRWQWIKGHAGDRWNERVDELARAARESLGPSGPRVAGGAREAGARAASARRADGRPRAHVYVAASYSAKTGAGGWGAVVREGDARHELAGALADTTANRAQIQAAIHALDAVDASAPVAVWTVSDYVKDGATRWRSSWQQRGWRTRDGKPVSHRELWQELFGRTDEREVEWAHVSKGDPPEELERAKALSREAAASR